MLNFLLAVEHLPALYAQHLSIGLGLNEVETLDEVFPLGRITLDHDLRDGSLAESIQSLCSCVSSV